MSKEKLSSYLRHLVGVAQRTLEGVLLEMVGWRRRDETGVKPTEIEVPSISHVNDTNHSLVVVRRYLVGEGYMFQDMGVPGLGYKERLVAQAHFRHIRKSPNRPRKK